MNNYIKKNLVGLLILFLAQNSQAFLLDINSGILQGGFTRTTDQSSSRLVNSLGVFANLSKSDTGAGVNLGWYILSVTNKDVYPATINQTLTSSDMGPAVRWQFDKRRQLSLTLAYGIICKGNYTDDSVNENLSGTSYFLKFAFEPEFAERYYIGVALNYYAANYTSMLVGSAQSDISYKNTWIYPSLSFSYRY